MLKKTYALRQFFAAAGKALRNRRQSVKCAAILFAIFPLIFHGVVLSAQVSVLTANYGNDRTNANLNERILNTSDVNTRQFGKLFSLAVDGQVYAQPLFAGGVTLPGGAAVNVLYAATMHNSVYAFDADSGSLIWQVNLGPSVSSSDYLWPYHVADIDPEIGILSTPVIDSAAHAIYVVAATCENGNYIYRLHALDLATGSEVMNGPVVIQASVPGNAPDGAFGVVSFNPEKHLQRPGLLLLNGSVYMAFASHGDEDPYHGWIIGYNSHDLSQQTGVFNVTPNGMEGGIWQGGHGLASDDSGSIYAISGNGDFDGTRNFGQSFLRLNSAGLALSASFTPDNWLDLDDGDTDIGSSGPVLIRGKNLLLGANKGGVVYVVDAAHMGGLQSGNPQVVQMLQARRGPIFNMALWNGPNGEILYIEGADAGVNAYCMSARTFNPAPCSSNSSVPATAKAGMAISANGNKRGTGILWITTGSGSGATLRAFDATDVSNEIWNSDQSGGPDALGSFAKFATPTIAAGRVYVPTFSGQIVVYGLTSQSNVLGRLTGLKR